MKGEYSKMSNSVLSNDNLAINQSFYDKLRPGKILSGTVRSIQKYGVFVELDKNITGLLHIENISTSRIHHPSERFKVGQKIKVVVKSIDFDTGKIVLSHKELLGTWEDNIKKFSQGDVVEGVVRDKEKSGIFIELLPNLVGLAEYVRDVSYGEKVQVKIKKILPDRHKIKLVILD